MSNFKIGDLIVPNDKFYKTPSGIIADKMFLFVSFIDDFKKAFNNDSSPLRITNINKGVRGTVWLRVSWEGRHTATDRYGTEVDAFSYPAEYFELYEEKELNNLVLDYKLIDKLM